MSEENITELKTTLTGDKNEVGQNGILTTLGQRLLGDRDISNVARAKILTAKIGGDITGAELTELNSLLTTSGKGVGEEGLLQQAEKVFTGAIQTERIGRIRTLIADLVTEISESVSPSVSLSRSPSASPSPSHSPSASQSISESLSASPSPSASLSESPSASPSPSASLSQSPSRSVSVSPSASPSAA